jgi:hypothetical protein
MSISEISRQEEIENLYNICIRLYDNTKDKDINDDSFKNIISLNGGYGSGKTVFLKAFEGYVKQQGNPHIVKLNIWEDDFADDPLIPILHTIAEHEIFKEIQDKIAFLMSILKGTGFIVKTSLTFLKIDITEHIDDFIAFLTDKNINLENIQELSEKSKEFKAFITQAKAYFENKKTVQSAIHKNLKKIDAEFFIKKQVIQLVKKCLHDTVLNTDKPFFILVDELDRCRPDYAVTTLERIKHIFNVPRLIFILAVDRKQLEHSVRHAFGADWDFDNYYLRFAPLEINLGRLSEKFSAKELLEENLYKNLLESIQQNSCLRSELEAEAKIQEIFVQICDEANLRPRTLIHTIEKRKVLDILPEYLIPMIFLSTDNDYRDSFYKIYIEYDFIHETIQRNIKKLFDKLMGLLLEDGEINGLLIFDILALFCLPKINGNINYNYVDKNGNHTNYYLVLEKPINNLYNAISSKKTTNDYGSKIPNYMQNDTTFVGSSINNYFLTLKIITKRTNIILNEYDTLKQHQPTLKALFEHYKPIENE